jgi:hypothetical protein
MKKLNLILTIASLSLCIVLTAAYWMGVNHQAGSGWGMAAVWCANTFLYQLRDKE